MPHDIVYPQGCRPVTDDLGPDELIRRLKMFSLHEWLPLSEIQPPFLVTDTAIEIESLTMPVICAGETSEKLLNERRQSILGQSQQTLAHTLQAMDQDEGMYQQYIPLALHLADDYFLHHPSRDVQLLIACCIADVLRVYAPEAPYKDPEQVKTIFLFLIKQLSGLKDPKDPAFKRYFYLLENLAYVKSFNMCFELDDCQEIFCKLFSLMFRIVNDEHSGKVKSFMLDVLCPLITESDLVSNELLNIILMNIVEPNKTQRKNAYLLAKELVIKCSDTLEPYIQTFFNHVLILGKEEKQLEICGKVYDLIYELNHICPSVLLAVLPQLECKLKSSQESERLGAVSLLARMFSERDSNLARHHTQLWRAFLGRFNDISVAIRIKCVQHSMHFLLNHPELRKDITETLKLRQHDSEENVRYEVVMAIVQTAKRDFEVVSDSEDLLEFVKERTLDKKFKIRKEAMSGLALIYRKHLNDADVPQATKKAVTWIKDKILHGYYMCGMEDRLLVERLLNTCLVPFQLPTEERMKKLYHLLGTVDDHATKAFIELEKHQLAVRRSVAEWLELHRRPQSMERDREIVTKVAVLSRYLPEPVKAQEFLTKFSSDLLRDGALLAAMENIVRPDISCKECADTTSLILKKLGQPVMTNLYYNTVKMLLERISSVMVDHQSIKVLVGYIEDCLKGGNMIEEMGLHPNTAGERGLKLLVILSFVFPSHFLHEDVITHLVSFLDMEDETVAPLVLSVLTFLGRYKPIGELFPDIVRDLVPVCKKFAEVGTTKQAKQAIRCLYVNLTHNVDSIFTEILEKVKSNLNQSSEYYRTAIVALGHIAYNLPDRYPVHLKNIVSRKIVKELLVKEAPQCDSVSCALGNWCLQDQLPEETRCKLEGMKTMARWLLGLKEDVLSAQKTFRMLNAFVMHDGDLLQQGRYSKAEMAWLRLGAGCAMLKICEQKGVGDQYSAEQFYNLSRLMTDEVPQVREIFATKLHKGLGRGIPQKCLPLDFMGFYALGGIEPDKRIKMLIKQNMVVDINKRREYVKSISMGAIAGLLDKGLTQLTHILPDYMMVFAVPVLTHHPFYTSHEDLDQLMKIKQCLWFVMEPLITKNDLYCFGFYKSLIERMKNHKDAFKGDEDAVNHKMWAVCDLAMSLIMSKTTNFDMKEFPSEARIPTMYFRRHEDNIFVNTRIYIPPELQSSAKRNVPSSTNNTIGAPITGTISGTGVADRGARKARGRPTRPVPSNTGIGATGENDVKLEAPIECIDAEPSEASETKIQLPGIEEESEGECGEPPAKRTMLDLTPKVEQPV